MSTTVVHEPSNQCRAWQVIERFRAEDVHRAVGAMDTEARKRFAKLTGLPLPALDRNRAAAKLLRKNLRGRTNRHTAFVAMELAGFGLAAIQRSLGERADDPSFEELTQAVDATIDSIGTPLVVLTLAAAVDLEFPAASQCERLLATDGRLALDALGPIRDDSAAMCAKPEARSVDPEVRARRQARKVAARTGRAQPAATAPRYRRARRDVEDLDLTVDTSDDAFAPAATECEFRRSIRVVEHWPSVSYDDPLVGNVLFAFVPYLGPRCGGKERPCVVIATSGVDHLVVRPCYSEGRFQSRKWKSFRVTDLVRAGLWRTSYISSEEMRIARSAVVRELGELAPIDWNHL